MTHTITVTTNLDTHARRLYVDGMRVTQARFDEYRSIGVFFTEHHENYLRRYHAVAVKR
jgi:hypothetical protein